MVKDNSEMIDERILLRDTAIGKIKADLVIKNGKLVNVYTREIYQADVSIKGKRIAFVGDVEHTINSNTRILDAGGNYLIPGFVDAHHHQGGSQLTMTRWAEALLSNGTTSIATDLWELGSVVGVKGLRFALDEAEAMGLNVLFMVPVVSYMQHNPFGCSESISEKELFEMLDWPENIGINEPPPQWLLDGNETMLRLVDETLNRGKIVEGHAAETHDKELQAYIGWGPISDHECLSSDEAISKLRLGMSILIREGSAAVDLANVIKAITENHMPSENFMLATDERDPGDLYNEGHFNFTLKKAIRQGLNPITGIQLATLNPARYLRKDHDIGSITPGRFADILITDSLLELNLDYVISKGEIVVQKRKFIKSIPQIKYPAFLKTKFNLKKTTELNELSITTDKRKDSVKVCIPNCVDGTLVSERKEVILPVKNGIIQTDVSKDVAKMVALERHRATGRIGKAFVSGFGLKSGAFAQTYNPVTNNLTVLGTSDEEILFAIQEIQRIGGGFVVVEKGELLASLHLPIIGVFSDQPLEIVQKEFKEVTQAIHKLGSQFKSPMLSLGFMAMAYGIPTYKLSEYGLVDVEKLELVDLVIE
jgi:adenine deaminase